MEDKNKNLKVHIRRCSHQTLSGKKKGLFTSEVKRKKKRPKEYHFTDQQVKAAIMWSQNTPYSKIIEELGLKHTSQISTTLSAFRKTAPHMRSVIKELSDVGYFEKLTDRRAVGLRIWERQRPIIKQKLLNGLWFGFVPYGYVKIKGKIPELQPHPEKFERMKHALERVSKGEVPYSVAKDEGIKYPTFHKALRNPVYKGWIRFDGEVLPGKHKPMVDEETWNTIQEMLKVAKPGRVRLVQRRIGTEVVNDPEMVRKMRDACEARVKRKTIEEISFNVGLSKWLLHELFTDRFYRDVVGATLWDKASAVKISRKEGRIRVGERNRDKILRFLLDSKGKAFSKAEIAKETHLSHSPVLRHLHELHDKGLVQVRKADKQKLEWFV